MDCDLQDPPELIPAFYAKCREGFDLVLGRRLEKRHSALKRAISSAYLELISKFNPRVPRADYGALSILSRKVVDAYLTVNDVNPVYLLTLFTLGFDRAEIPYQHGCRHAGRSSYDLVRTIRHATNVIFFYTTTLLQLIVAGGFVCVAFGIAFAIQIIVTYAQGHPVPGWSSLSVLTIVMGGAVIITVGVVGLYVGCIFDQTKGRPRFIVQSRIN
jgi:dolichol-phosphate mannosyltransferase